MSYEVPNSNFQNRRVACQQCTLITRQDLARGGLCPSCRVTQYYLDSFIKQAWLKDSTLLEHCIKFFKALAFAPRVGLHETFVKVVKIAHQPLGSENDVDRLIHMEARRVYMRARKFKPEWPVHWREADDKIKLLCLDFAEERVGAILTYLNYRYAVIDVEVLAGGEKIIIKPSSIVREFIDRARALGFLNNRYEEVKTMEGLAIAVVRSLSREDLKPLYPERRLLEYVGERMWIRWLDQMFKSKNIPGLHLFEQFVYSEVSLFERLLPQYEYYELTYGSQEYGTLLNFAYSLGLDDSRFYRYLRGAYPIVMWESHDTPLTVHSRGTVLAFFWPNKVLMHRDLIQYVQYYWNHVEH